MNHTLLNEEEATRVRERFEKTFIETPQEYALSTAKWREETFAGNPNAHVYPTPNYDEVIYWSKIKSYKEIDFADAISFLSNIGNPVYFMSDPELEGCVGMHLLNSDSDSIGFVAVHNDSKEFAEYILYEWKKLYTPPDDEWYEAFLPFNMYVFDESFSWMLVFTHHNVNDFEPDRVENSCNRLCFIIRV